MQDPDKRKEILEAYESYQLHQIYQKLHNFCVVDMGGFYLDIIKDRQYTAKADGLPRRSCQTAMHIIIEAFTRWLAPILSFTAEELWPTIPGERGETVFTEEWMQLPRLADEQQRVFWQQIADAKNAYNKVLEQKKSEGINSSITT